MSALMRALSPQKDAKVMDASATVMMRFDSAGIGQIMSEIVAWGTAVILEPVV